MPFDIDRVCERLPGRRIEWLASTPSTMTVAAKLAHEGAPSGTIVGADQQTAGMGRHGRSWHSEPEAGLYVSIVLRLPVRGDSFPIIMLALGLATQQAIAEISGLAPDLRWPNDVLVKGKKCAGILAQFEYGAVIAGIGINVSHSSFPPDIADLATSLKLAGASKVTREDMLIALAHSVDDCSKILVERSPVAVLDMFSRASSYAQGRRVHVDLEDSVVEGVTQGLDSSGFLRLRQDNGKELVIRAGGVRPV